MVVATNYPKHAVLGVASSQSSTHFHSNEEIHLPTCFVAKAPAIVFNLLATA
jgi:hypothetical protein